ncbi:MAG TPA: cysteine peptidase family C39 domain-containing protein [Pirellulales bacterium]|nr:cysteine peptidase family C39 domain-containing protein [Pirellulales bacterium]
MTLFPALLAIAIAGAVPEKSTDVDMRCGAYCLYVSLKALQPSAPSYAEIEAKLGAPSPAGYSLGALADVAEAYGAQTLGVVTDPENLASRSRPFACIARLGENHFVNIGDVAGGMATIIDAPRKYDLPLDTLRTSWDGTALLVSMSPLTPEEELAPRSWRMVGIVALAGFALLATAVVFYRRRGGAT